MAKKKKAFNQKKLKVEANIQNKQFFRVQKDLTGSEKKRKKIIQRKTLLQTSLMSNFRYRKKRVVLNQMFQNQ